MWTLLGHWNSVLIREVSWFQGWNNTHFVTKWSVLIIQDVLISGSPNLGVPLYYTKCHNLLYILSDSCLLNKNLFYNQQVLLIRLKQVEQQNLPNVNQAIPSIQDPWNEATQCIQVTFEWYIKPSTLYLVPSRVAGLISGVHCNPTLYLVPRVWPD